MYDLPETNLNGFATKIHNVWKNKTFQVIALIILIVVIAIGYVEFFTTGYAHDKVNAAFEKIETSFSKLQLSKTPALLPSASSDAYVSQISYEQAIINTVKSASPSVVSIVISQNLPVYQEQMVNPFGDMPDQGGVPFNFEIPEQVQDGTKLQEVGAGSGFIVSSDGLVLTNKHVVSDTNAQYTVFTNDGTKYSAKVLALDPVEDLAIIKIESPSAGSLQRDSGQAGQAPTFPAIKIGDSDGIEVGQTAVAIGNALGQFSNTVSVGVVSGLGRTISASEQGNSDFSEDLQGIIQTDAAINPGNSGGPLLNLKGEVIGINTAMADDAQSIGFAIPINIAKKDISQIETTNKITYPFLGVRYIQVDADVAQQYKLSVDYGAYVLKGPNGEAAVTAGSAADKAGIKEGDVILEVNGEKITDTDPMQTIISKYNPGDTVTLHILRAGKEMDVPVTLGTRS